MAGKSKKSSLPELLSSLQNLQSQQIEDTGKLRRRLEWLETRRKEFFNIVSTTGSDFESRRKLEETEVQLAELQQMMTRADQELREARHEIRARILELRNQELLELEQEGKALRKRRDEIRVTLLPEAQARVASLAEEDEKLQTRGEDLAKRIRELTQLDLPTTEVA